MEIAWRLRSAALRMRSRYVFATITLSLHVIGQTAGTRGPMAESITRDLAEDNRPPSSSAILLALESGDAGQAAIAMWSSFANGHMDDAAVDIWALSRDESINEAVRLAPGLRSLTSDKSETWTRVIDRFADETDAAILGFFGEGSLPHAGLATAILSLPRSLGGVQTPSAVISRSRRAGEGGKGSWLPDTFVSHIWLNRILFEHVKDGRTGLPDATVGEQKFLEYLPTLLSESPGTTIALVDGTNVVPSIFAADRSSLLPVAKFRRGNLYIGSLKLALLEQEEDGTALDILRPSWPPRYIMETVASEKGVVIVSNVNCGYLDMSANFLLSVRRVSSETKVLFVAMDEVSFDFMDAMAPGSTVLFPLQAGAEREHATKAGSFGDTSFAAEVLIRPSILVHMMKQNFTVLWSDSDIVWLQDPIPLLPDPTDPSSSEAMFQIDGNMTCTCFMYLQPTANNFKLMKTWKQNIIQTKSNMNQPPFREPLRKMEMAGLRASYLDPEVMPHGRAFFNKAPVENYPQEMKPQARIAHNNFIKGHEKKRERFVRYHLWWVEDMVFPQCGEEGRARRRRLR